MTRAELLTAVCALPGSHAPPGYVLDSDETDDHVTHDTVFCRVHADMVARIDALLVAASMHISDVSWGESDGNEYCAFYGCGVELNTGSLTSYGVDSSLGLTEERPLECAVSPYELRRSALAMRDSDPRWATWEAQGRRVLRWHRTRRSRR